MCASSIGCLFILTSYLTYEVTGHVRLTFPPARTFALDLLDNVDNVGPCGAPPYEGAPRTTFVEGTAVRITWYLGAPVEGGSELQIINENPFEILSSLTRGDYIFQNHSTGQYADVIIPIRLECAKCTLRLLRQSKEMGENYRYWSCADITILTNLFAITDNCVITTPSYTGPSTTTSTLSPEDDEAYGGKVYDYYENETIVANTTVKTTFETSTKPETKAEETATLMMAASSQPTTVEEITTNTTAFTTQKSDTTSKTESTTTVAETTTTVAETTTTVAETTTTIEESTTTVEEKTTTVAENTTTVAAESTASVMENITSAMGNTTVVMVITTLPMNATVMTTTSDLNSNITETTPPLTIGIGLENASVHDVNETTALSPQEGQTGKPSKDVCIPETATPYPSCFTRKCLNGGTCDEFTGLCSCLKLFSGKRCEEYDECWDDSDCNNGKCIDTRSLTHPRFICYCESGWHGDHCDIQSSVSVLDNYQDNGDYKSLELKHGYISIHWKLIGAEAIEIAVRGKTNSWVGIGWRPMNINASCKNFPTPESTVIFDEAWNSVLENQNGKALTEKTPNPDVEVDIETELISKAKAKCNQHDEPEAEPQPQSRAGEEGNETTAGDHPISYEPDPDEPFLTAAGKALNNPMDCSDIVVGAVKGDLHRVQDMYTRDRSTPRPDSFYNGQDDITGSAGSQVDGYTTIVFRKKLQAGGHSDHTISNQLMNIIWAMGQDMDGYISRAYPAEKSCNAPNNLYNLHDKVSYHGRHRNQRGRSTLNFFAKAPSPNVCADKVGEYKEPDDCVTTKAGFNCAYYARWEYVEKEDGIEFILKSQQEQSKWIGIGFSEDQKMTNSDVIIAWIDQTGHPVVKDRWISDYSLPVDDEQRDIADVYGNYADGVMTIQFLRTHRDTGDNMDLPFSDVMCQYFLFPTGPLNVDGDEIAKHATTPTVSARKICIRACGTAKTTAFSTSITLTASEFTEELKDSNSSEYKKLKERMERVLTDNYQRLHATGVLDVYASVTGFEVGSVKVNYDVMITYEENVVSESEVKASLMKGFAEAVSENEGKLLGSDDPVLLPETEGEKDALLANNEWQIAVIVPAVVAVVILIIAGVSYRVKLEYKKDEMFKPPEAVTRAGPPPGKPVPKLSVQPVSKAPFSKQALPAERVSQQPLPKKSVVEESVVAARKPEEMLTITEWPSVLKEMEVDATTGQLDSDRRSTLRVSKQESRRGSLSVSDGEGAPSDAKISSISSRSQEDTRRGTITAQEESRRSTMAVADESTRESLDLEGEEFKNSRTLSSHDEIERRKSSMIKQDEAKKRSSIVASDDESQQKKGRMSSLTAEGISKDRRKSFAVREEEKQSQDRRHSFIVMQKDEKDKVKTKSSFFFRKDVADKGKSTLTIRDIDAQIDEGSSSSIAAAAEAARKTQRSHSVAVEKAKEDTKDRHMSRSHSIASEKDPKHRRMRRFSIQKIPKDQSEESAEASQGGESYSASSSEMDPNDSRA